MRLNIEDSLGLELKRELAERYFGFRKLIEEDKLSLSEKINHHAFILEKRITFDLVRIYILLAEEALVQEFTTLVGWHEKLYYDNYLGTSVTIRRRIFKGIGVRGLTRSGRFKNLVFDAYERLEEHVGFYREGLEALRQEQAVINEEIDLFYRKNDFTSIMGFFRGLGGDSMSSGMNGKIESGQAESFEEKMRIEYYQPIEQQLPIIQPMAPLQTISRPLKKLVERAYKIHGVNFMVSLMQGFPE